MATPMLVLLVAALGLATAVALIYWHQILQWAEESLFPWFHTHIPELEPAVREAFRQVDKVAVAVRRSVRKAWEQVREYLLKLVVVFRRRSTSVWVKEVTSWLVRGLDVNKPAPVKVTTTEDVSWDDLPDEVKVEFLKRKKRELTVNVTEMRDHELEIEI